MNEEFQTIPEVIRQQVNARPNQAAIIESPGGAHRQITYQELDVRSAAFARHLLKRGICPGDSVLVFVPMSISLYTCLLGLFKIGATALFLDPSAGLRHIRDCCALRAPRAFLGSWKAHLLRIVSPALRSIPQHFWISSNPLRLPASDGLEPLPCPGPEEPALITFTSGSTGRPKAVVRTHRFLIAQHKALEEAIELRPGERDLTTLPVFVLANLASGVTSILPDSDMGRPGHASARRVRSQVERYQPDRTGGSPAFYARLITDSPPGDPGILASFHKIYTGGAPVFPSLLQKIQNQSPESKVVAVYGSTEAEPIAHIAWDHVTTEDIANMRNGKGLIAGFPVPQISVAILDGLCGTNVAANDNGRPIALTLKDFQQMKVSAHVAGEICVTGDHVLKGYLNGHGDSETKFSVDGTVWHRTGDAGYLDEEGKLWLLGRASAKVEDSRGVLYPFAVECVAQTYPFVARSAFVGRNGRRILIIEYSSEIKPESEEMVALRKSLKWAAIDEIRSVATIPVDKRHNAKVDYPALYKLVDKLIRK